MEDFLKQITKEHYRVVRIDGDPNNQTQFTELMEWLDTFPFYVLGIEKVPKLHYHIVIKSDDPKSYGSQNNKLTTQIKNLFDVNKSQFSTSSVRTTVRKSIMYSIKECEYRYKGISEEDISNIQTQSTLKYKKQEFSDKLEQLENQFYDDKITLEQFNDRYRYLKIVQYGQNPNMQSETRYIVKHYIRKSKDAFQKYADKGISEVYKMIGDYDIIQ